MKNHREQKLSLWLILFIITLTLSVTINITAESTKKISGIVEDEKAIPIEGAWVAPLYGSQIGAAVKTTSEGRFTINVNTNLNQLIIYADKNTTEGHDYLPQEINLNKVNLTNVQVMLQPAGSIKFSGVIQHVESESLASSIAYSALNEKGEVIYRLLYRIPGWDKTLITLPVGTKYVNIEFTLPVPNLIKLIKKSFNITIPDEINQGDLIEYEYERFTVPWNRNYVDGYLDSTKPQLISLKENRFYIVKESLTITEAENQLQQSETLYSENDYVGSYMVLKNAFIKIKQVNQTLETLRTEAFRSIYVILFFFAVSSIILGHVIFDNKLTCFSTGIGIYAVSSIILYVVYPGTMLISLDKYLFQTLTAIILAVSLTILLPKIFVKSGVKGGSSLRAVSQQTFTLAKRLMKRRQTRTLLTILSISLLTMSFVSLTSFSEEYGVSLNKAYFASTEGSGLFITSAIQSNYTVPLRLSNDEYIWLNNLQGVKSIAPKYINLPQIRALTVLGHGRNGISIMGVIGIDSVKESEVTNINEALIGGNLPNSGEVAFSQSMMKKLNLTIGDILYFSAETSLTICGILEDSVLRGLRELDGSFYLPTKMIVISEGVSHINYAQVVCEPDEIVIVDYRDAFKYTGNNPVRLVLDLEDDVDIQSLAERIALERGYRTTAASEKGVYTYVLGTYLEGKGLPLIIPWSIVVLSVVTTMINSLYERRKEINIMSAVGLNPSHVTSIFVMEGLLVGFVGGGLGYITGLSLYRVMDYFGLSFNVEQKVSALWSLASVGLAVSAVLVGAFVALKSSVVITPSLTRKWVLSEKKEAAKPFEIVIPVKLKEDQIDEFTEYVLNSLKSLESGEFSVVSFIRFFSEDHRRVIQFVYKSVYSGPGSYYARNSLVVGVNVLGEYGVTLFVYGESDWAHESGSLVRKIIIEWSNREQHNLI